MIELSILTENKNVPMMITNALMLNPGNMFHSLEGKRKKQYAISINKQWRVCFEWHDDNAFNVAIVDYH
jgi:proteic killer suppression protein